MSRSSVTVPADWKDIRGTPFVQFFNTDAIENDLKKNHDEFDKNLDKTSGFINKIENKSKRIGQHLSVIGTTNQNLKWINQLR